MIYIIGNHVEKEDAMPIKETVYAAIYKDEEGEYVLLNSIAPTPEAADDLDADFRKNDFDQDYHGEYQRIGKFIITEVKEEPYENVKR